MSVAEETRLPLLEIAPSPGGQFTDDMRRRLNPDVVELFAANWEGKPQVQEMPPHYFKKSKGSYVPGALTKAAIGSEEEFTVPRKYTKPYGPVPIVVYTPEGEAPAQGWPIIFNIHGGGWVLGSATSEESLSTRLCAQARAVVVSPEYRLAPDSPYPAAIEDCWEVLLWLWEHGPAKLRIDTSRFIIGGASAGGHLAATMINMLQEEPTAPKGLSFKLNLMTVPVTDNTAIEPHLGSPTWNDYPSWTENKDAPALQWTKMLWYRNLFIPNPEHRLNWHASPMLAPDRFWAQHPPTWVGVAECDILRDEGIAYAKKLEKAGVPVKLEIFKGIPHPTVMQGAAVAEGRRFAESMIEAARAALWD